MSDTNTSEPSWKKFTNFQGPTPQEEHKALQDWNLRKRSMIDKPNQDGSSQRCKMGQRIGKFRFKL